VLTFDLQPAFRMQFSKRQSAIAQYSVDVMYAQSQSVTIGQPDDRCLAPEARAAHVDCSAPPAD